MKKIVDGALVDMTDEEVAAWEAEQPSAADTLAAYAVTKRWETEVSGILFDGYGIPTDDRGKGLVSGAYQKALADANETKLWQVSNSPITFVTFSNAQIVALGLAVEAFTQATFDKLAAVAADIDSGDITTTAEIDAAFADVSRVYTSV
jgi:hypothetical protein